MNVESQGQWIIGKRLAKKPRKLVASNNISFVETVFMTVPSTFKAKSTLISHTHIRLRDRTLQNHQGKLHKLSSVSQVVAVHQRHFVELTDDVVVVDRYGHRVPPPSYATLRIDQLPQFKKG